MEDKKRNRHNEAYKSLFKTKDEFIYFLQKYIAEPWTVKIKADDLEPVDTTFITEDLEDRYSDIIYKLRLENNGEIYFYVLLELQSAVDYTMPFSCWNICPSY